jgi:hypothetical protein
MVQVEGKFGTRHRFGLQLHPTVRSPDQRPKDRPLEPHGLPMDLHRLHVLTPQVRGKEWFGRRVVIDEDRVITDRTGQDVGDWAEDGVEILPEEKGRSVEARLARLAR